jgi:hypothetical protein
MPNNFCIGLAALSTPLRTKTMKTLCPAILLAALCATAHADVDIDTARKLAAVDRQCLRQDDLVKVFQSAPVASASPVFPEPTLPYIPVRTYQFLFPGHSDSEMYLRVVQTGDCITTVDLIRN